MVNTPSYHAWMVWDTLHIDGPKENDYRAYVGQVFVHKERKCAPDTQHMQHIFEFIIITIWVYWIYDDI